MLHTIEVGLFLTLWPTAEIFSLFLNCSGYIYSYSRYIKKYISHNKITYLLNNTPFAYSKENACNLWWKI